VFLPAWIAAQSSAFNFSSPRLSFLSTHLCFYSRSKICCVALTDYPGWEAAEFGVGCEAFDGTAEADGPLSDFYNPDGSDLGLVICDIGFLSNRGGATLPDITANEACIVCGACDTCTGMCISSSFPFRNFFCIEKIIRKMKIASSEPFMAKHFSPHFDRIVLYRFSRLSG
jgi:ferredoxin